MCQRQGWRVCISQGRGQGNLGCSASKPLPGVLQPRQEGHGWVWGGLQHPGLAGMAASGWAEG